MPRPNDKIGPYTLIRRLGRGGFAEVWLAERRGAFATTEVAVKLALDDDPDLNAIAQESQLWARLAGHPNVLPIIEADNYDGQVVIVSEYAPDGSLDTWLKKHGGTAPSIERAALMASGILAGLSHLHFKNIIHRDLKPANILLQEEIPRLADFGLARVLKASSHSGAIAGTPPYMSPEAFDGERSEQSDIWSAGVILYQMLTGRLPFGHGEIGMLLRAIIMKDPDPLPSSIPPPFQEVISCALQKDPAQRYRSASEMRTALHGFFTANASIAGALLPEISLPQPAQSISNGEEKLQLHTYYFEIVAVNAKGKIVERRKGEARYFVEDIGDGTAIDITSIPEGSFLMGSPDAEKGRGLDESPQHWVNVPAFYMSKYPITQAQWRAAAKLPKADRNLDPDPSTFKGDDLPVEQISWEDAVEFCARLSIKTEKNYWLPTEAEWEYGCRAGTTTPFAFGETITTDLANYNGAYPYGSAPRGLSREKTSAVGSLGAANAFGLYDMHGNVWEWCADSYRGDYQSAQSEESTFEGKSYSSLKVMRGGSWYNLAGFCRSAYRNRNLPIYRNLNVGFRVVVSFARR